MLMQHIGVGYFGYHNCLAMKHSLMPRLLKLRMKGFTGISTGIRSAADAFDVSTRTLNWWRRLRTGGPEALIPKQSPSGSPFKELSSRCTQEIRRLRTELPLSRQRADFCQAETILVMKRGILPVPARQPLEESLLVLTIKCG